jgi:cell division septum initiation protein DivIVA
MSMIDTSGYYRQGQAAKNQFGALSARNAYAHFLSQTRGKRNLSMLKERQATGVPRLISSYTQRNLAGPGITSGIFSKGLQDYAIESQRSQQDIQDDINSGLKNFELESAQNQADLNARLIDLEEQKNREIANSASALTSYKPFLG